MRREHFSFHTPPKKNIPASVSTKQSRMAAKIRDLLWLIICARIVFTTTRGSPFPLWFQGDECTCAPRRDSLFGYALHRDPLAPGAEHWSQAAPKEVPRDPGGGGLGGLSLLKCRVVGHVCRRWFVKQIHYVHVVSRFLIQLGHVYTEHFSQLVTPHGLFYMA